MERKQYLKKRVAQWGLLSIFILLIALLLARTSIYFRPSAKEATISHVPVLPPNTIIPNVISEYKELLYYNEQELEIYKAYKDSLRSKIRGFTTAYTDTYFVWLIGDIPPSTLLKRAFNEKADYVRTDIYPSDIFYMHNEAECSSKE